MLCFSWWLLSANAGSGMNASSAGGQVANGGVWREMVFNGVLALDHFVDLLACLITKRFVKRGLRFDSVVLVLCRVMLAHGPWSMGHSFDSEVVSIFKR